MINQVGFEFETNLVYFLGVCEGEVRSSITGFNLGELNPEAR